MATSSPGVVQRARFGMHRAAVKRQLVAVVEGKAETVDVDVTDTSLDLAALIQEVSGGPRPSSQARYRLAVAFQKSGAFDRVVDQFESAAGARRLQSAKIAGTLSMEYAVTLLSSQLSAKEPDVRTAAARALGRIGGAACAEALLRSMRRRGPSRTLICELARAAPDLFLEVALCAPQRVGVKHALAAAAGLRRRRAAVTPLLALLESGSRRERAACCKALSWIGARNSAPAIADALHDSDWRVRMTAAKALARLGEDAYMTEVDALASDPDPRVRKVALDVRRQLFDSMSRRVWEWSWR